jgi:hypothetical protein
LNVIELELCMNLQWHLSCRLDTLQTYYQSLVRTSSAFTLDPAVSYPSTATAYRDGEEFDVDGEG